MDVWAGWADDYKVGLTNDLRQKHPGWRSGSILSNDRVSRHLDSVQLRLHPPPPGAEVSFDLRSFINHEPSFWLIAFLAFALGFYWEFRRAAR
jgi:hypothetical protein